MADNGGKGRLNEKEILCVVKDLNVHIPDSVVKQKFKVLKYIVLKLGERGDLS